MIKNKTSKKIEQKVQVSNKAFAYIRVSTSKQDTKTQRFEIEKYAKANEMNIDMFVEETISGKVDIEDRDLSKILKVAKWGDTIICTEVSRLARTMQGISSVMNICVNRGIKLITMKENYVLDANSPTSKFILSVYAFTAETERGFHLFLSLVSEENRTRSRKEVCYSLRKEVLKFH